MDTVAALCDDKECDDNSVDVDIDIDAQEEENEKKGIHEPFEDMDCFQVISFFVHRLTFVFS